MFVMSTRWKDLGFLEPPVLILAKGGERMYRVWGGWSTEMADQNPDGLTLSLTEDKVRSTVEKALAVMEYGNAIRYVTCFEALPELPAWLGRVHPGEREVDFGNWAGSQVFVERKWTKLVRKIGEPKLIENDMPGVFVVKNKSTLSS